MQEKYTGYQIGTQKENFGHGNVDVVQVLSPGMRKEDLANARLLVYVQPYNITGRKELSLLQSDLLALAKARQHESPQEKIITMGLAYTGKRNNDARLVSGFPENVHVTRMQLEKAQDLVAATSRVGKGRNTEVIAYSAGGPVAATALSLGLHADKVGLFNAAGLDDKGNFRTHQRVLLESFKSIFKVPIDKIVNLFKYRGQEGQVTASEPKRSLWDRLRRSRAEQTSVGRAEVGALLNNFPETKFVIGNSKSDWIYPRRRVRKVLRETGQNVSFVDLDWSGHVMGKNRMRRNERLALLVKAMQIR